MYITLTHIKGCDLMKNGIIKFFSVIIFSTLLVVCMMPFSAASVYGQDADKADHNTEVTETDNPDSENLTTPISPVEPEMQRSHVIAVNGGSTDFDEASPGTLINLTADTPEEGQVFDHWEFYTEGAQPKDIHSSVTTFVMPDNDVSVWAVFKDKNVTKDADKKVSDENGADSLSDNENTNVKATASAEQITKVSSQTSKAPLTGDRNRIMTLVIIVVAAILALLILLTKKRNKK